MLPQQVLLEEIKGKLNEHQNLVSVLMEALHLSQSQAYRRVNGKVNLSFEEACMLINKFDVSTSKFLAAPKEEKMVHFNASLRINTSYLEFLRELQSNIEQVAQLPDVNIQYATNEFPIFYTFLYPNLIKFKIYMWNTTFWKNKQQRSRFVLGHIDPEEVTLSTSIKEAYLNLPTTEYWSIRLTDNTLNQIQYAAESGLFENIEDAIQLCDELNQAVQEVAGMAQKGRKELSNDVTNSKSGAFQLYLSELPTNIHFLVSHQYGQRLYTTFDNPNFLFTEDETVCKYILNWLENLKNKSIQISETGDRARNQFFHGLTKKINSLSNDLKVEE